MRSAVLIAVMLALRAAPAEAAFERGRERTIRLVDRGVMIEPLSTPVQQRTPYLGIPGLRRYLQDLDETWQEFDVSVQELRASGDHVVARGRIRARQQTVITDDAASFLVSLRTAHAKYAKAGKNNPLKVTVNGNTTFDLILN